MIIHAVAHLENSPIPQLIGNLVEEFIAQGIRQTRILLGILLHFVDEFIDIFFAGLGGLSKLITFGKYNLNHSDYMVVIKKTI